jgi:hypothetical protein
MGISMYCFSSDFRDNDGILVIPISKVVNDVSLRFGIYLVSAVGLIRRYLRYVTLKSKSKSFKTKVALKKSIAQNR